ncbi:uncharacterized protein LOC135137801 isoform X2 [Zophobas morio]|uniref:uncharacterized protein LOC135137801 isoform X2 n=1 Tax=Zophobas morio TaxID=2755281 RepID=UPI003082EB7D
MYKCKSTMAVLAKNCNHFFKYNPPVVIFFLCLVIVTLVTVSFTIYIKYTENIINNDDKQNWISLSRHLNKLNLCVITSDGNVLNENSNEEGSFATLVSLKNVNEFINVTKVEIYYYLEDWKPLCGGNDENSPFLGINFGLTQNFTENENGTSVCALITGPKHFLPQDSKNSCDFNEEIDDENTITFYSQSEFCPDSDNETQINLSFEVDNVETYLSQSDKNVIYIHLLWSSYILLFFVVIMLIYAMFYQSQDSLKTYRLT